MADKFNFLSITGKGKGFRIFDSSTYKEHQQLPMARLFWNMRWGFIIWASCIIAFGIAFAMEYLWRNGWSPATATWFGVYFSNILHTGGMNVFAEVPYWIMRAIMRTDFACVAPLIPVIVYYMLTDNVLLEEFNPHGKDRYDEHSSRKATEFDIRKMGKLGGDLFKGFVIVLGYFKKKPIMFDETLSALCVAPPGTGKTAGVCIPSIFECDKVSMIINDPKPELKQKTSGYRATIGPVFIMNWAGQDDPARGIYYPSWNPLSPSHIPFIHEERDLYVDSIVNVLIADKAGSTGDPHWTITGRNALAGFVHFIVSKVEKAKANDYFLARLQSGLFDAEDAALLGEYYMMMQDPNAYSAAAALHAGRLSAMNYVHVGTWDGIPAEWIGKEACFSMILDWLTMSQMQINQQLEQRRKSGDQMVIMADPMRDLLEKAAGEAVQFGYNPRANAELRQLAATPDKERGSIISTALAGLGIFRNAAVRNRTSHSDFHFNDLRGMIDPADGKWKPVSVYLSINQVDADALNPITAMFIELMSRFLLTNLPKEKYRGQELGPFPVMFMLDEMPKMQKLQAVIQGPDLGRGCHVSYLIIGQDLHQISERYGQDAMYTIMSTTAAKIVLRQNDLESAKKFSDLMGDKITKKIKKDDKGQEVETPETRPLFSPMDILKLADSKQIIIMQGWAHRPIEADKEYWFKNPKLVAKGAIPEARPLPDFLIPAHHAAMGYAGQPIMKK